MAPTDQICVARKAMVMARDALDEYVQSSEPNPILFQVLFDDVQAATAEYAGLLKEQMEKSRPIIEGPL